MSPRVLTLAARAIPEDCGIWTASRAIIQALGAHGRMSHVFEVNSSQEDLAAGLNGGSQFIRPLNEGIPGWAGWVDGHHPSQPLFDKARDRLFLGVLGGWSASKAFYGARLARVACDVIHVPFQGMPFWPRRRGAPFAQFIWDFNPEYLPGFRSAEFHRWTRVSYENYRRAAAALTVGETVKEDAIRFARVDPERIFVAPFGKWPMPPPSTDGERDEVRRRFGLPEEFIFYPAPTRPHKNHERLVRALADLRRRGTRIPLVTTGKQRPHYEIMTALIEELGIADQVVFTDFVDPATINALYDMAAAVALPTMFEGACGIPLLEAMTKGKAIAASSACEIPQALGDAGLIFDPLSTDEIAAKLLALWESPALRLELGGRALARAESRSWERFAETCERAFEFAAERGGA